MVFKKYIKRGGKVYGPYLYENKRVDGKVVTTYVGLGKEERKSFGKGRGVYLVLVILAFLFLGIVFYQGYQEVLVGRAVGSEGDGGGALGSTGFVGTGAGLAVPVGSIRLFGELGIISGLDTDKGFESTLPAVAVGLLVAR